MAAEQDATGREHACLTAAQRARLDMREVLRAVSLRATSRPTWANLAIVDRSEAYDFFVYCQN